MDYESTKNEKNLTQREVDIKQEIKKLKRELVEISKNKKSRTIGLRQSITEIIWRVYDKPSGFTLAQLRKHYAMPMNDFCDHYEQARAAWDSGDVETVDQFFNIYV